MYYTLGDIIRNFKGNVQNINSYDSISFAIKGIGIIIVFLSLYIIINNLNGKAKKKNIIEDNVKKSINLNFLNSKIGIVKKYTFTLNKYLKEENLEKNYSKLLYLSLFLIVTVFLGLLYVNQILLAFISPVIILKILTKILEKLSTKITVKIEEELPYAIDDITRIFSKYSDLKTVIYEVSLSFDGVLKEIFENMARQMMSSPVDKVLMEFANKYDNIWFYSLMFTLLSYLEDTSKEETIDSLKKLRDMIEENNDRIQKAQQENKLTILVSYVLSVMAIIGFFLNLIFNSVGKSFFFESFGGLLCFIAGICLIISNLFINITISKKRD